MLAWISLLVGCRSEVSSSEWRSLVRYAEVGIGEWDVPGVALAVVVDGEIYGSMGLGVADLDTREPVTPTTRFRAASITKMHTAMAVLSLVEDGRLDLQAPITDVLPDFELAPDAEAGTLTLDNLMTHSSGLQANGTVSDCDEGGPYTLESFVLGAAPTWHQWTPPDILYNYANLGFGIAGLAAEAAAGMPYEDLMAERVFGPLGMDDTTFEVELAGDDVATGYTLDPETHALYDVNPLTERACVTEWPYGGMITTVEDLARSQMALIEDAEPVLDEGTFQAWTSSGWEFSSTSSYIYGLSSYEFEDIKVLVHGGTMGGFISQYWVAPDEGFGVVVMVNSDHSTTWPAEPYTKPTQLIVLKAFELFLGTPADPVEVTIRPVEEWTVFVGRYHEPYTYGDVEVLLEDDTLRMRLADPDLREVDLVPYSKNTFTYAQPDDSPFSSSVSFEMDDDDQVEWVMLDQGIAAPGPFLPGPDAADLAH